MPCAEAQPRTHREPGFWRSAQREPQRQGHGSGRPWSEPEHGFGRRGKGQEHRRLQAEEAVSPSPLHLKQPGKTCTSVPLTFLNMFVFDHLFCQQTFIWSVHVELFVSYISFQWVCSLMFSCSFLVPPFPIIPLCVHLRPTNDRSCSGVSPLCRSSGTFLSVRFSTLECIDPIRQWILQLSLFCRLMQNGNFATQIHYILGQFVQQFETTKIMFVSTELLSPVILKSGQCVMLPLYEQEHGRAREETGFHYQECYIGLKWIQGRSTCPNGGDEQRHTGAATHQQHQFAK